MVELKAKYQQYTKIQRNGPVEPELIISITLMTFVLNMILKVRIVRN